MTLFFFLISKKKFIEPNRRSPCTWDKVGHFYFSWEKILSKMPIKGKVKWITLENR